MTLPLFCYILTHALRHAAPSLYLVWRFSLAALSVSRFFTSQAIRIRQCVFAGKQRERLAFSLCWGCPIIPAGKFLLTCCFAFSTRLLLCALVHRVSLWVMLRHPPSSTTCWDDGHAWREM
jgi:hypothetical protein